MTLTETAQLLHKQLLEQAVPCARELYAYRHDHATEAPEYAPELSKLERLLGALFGTEPIVRPSRPARPRARRPERTMMSASRALRHALVATCAPAPAPVTPDP